MDGSETGTVAGSHVGVEGLDGIRPGHLTVLLVHVVGARAGVISDPDTEVLDLSGVLLVNLRKIILREPKRHPKNSGQNSLGVSIPP